MNLKKLFLYLFFLGSAFSLSSINAEPCNDWTQTFQVQELLLNQQSKHQNIVVFKNKTIGKVLMLDDMIQFAKSDEFIYHEMLAHVPLTMHPKAKKVLIVGGGDGAVLREVLKHDNLDEVTVVELDGQLVDACQKYFPELSKGSFEDPRVRLLIDDGYRYLKKTNKFYDVILVNTAQPYGPSKPLFKRDFFELCHKALNDAGILVTQNGSPIIQMDSIAQSGEIRKDIFADSALYLCPAPAHLTGIKSFIISVKNQKLATPSLKELSKRYRKINGELKYYSPRIHQSAFHVPNYIVEKLD